MIHRRLLGAVMAVGVLGALAMGTAPANATGATGAAKATTQVEAKETQAQKANRLAKKCLKSGVSGAEIVCIAKSQVGMKEWGNNCNAYTKRCEAWCGDFAAWVMKKAGGTAPSGYPGVVNWRKWSAVSKAKVKPGDVELRKDNSHIEIVVGVSGGKISTVGGNSGNKVTYHSNNNYATWDYRNNPAF